MEGVLTVNDKQIFAAVEIADHEVRLIVGEFFNTRFNIIKVERISVNGVSGNTVIDHKGIVHAIQEASIEAERMIGAPIKSIILGVPSYNMKRYALKSTVQVTGFDDTITVEDIREAIRKAQAVNVGKNYALIQTVCVKYTVNGISTRRIPIGEKAKELTVDIDLLCADRKLSFELVKCVEDAGLKVMDLYLDVYGCCKEAALFNQAVDQNVVILKMERQSTTLGLLSGGRLRSAMVLDSGLGAFCEPVVEKYGLQRDKVAELIKYSIQLDGEKFSNHPVYIWQDESGPRKILEQELYEIVSPKIQEWVESIANFCAQILQAGATTVIITGEGGEMQGLDHVLASRLHCEVRNYIPETLGGRNAGLTACLGLFYAYKDKLPITGYTDNSLDMDQFIRSVSYRENRAAGNPEDTITKKLKGILFDGKK